MQRFDPMWDKMEPFPEGEWVRYADAAALVAAERERCAMLCESTYPEWNPDDATFQKPCFDTPAECAAAIRGLGA